MKKPVPSFIYTLEDRQTEINWLDVARILKLLGYDMKVEKRRPGGAVASIRIFPIDHKTPDAKENT